MCVATPESCPSSPACAKQGACEFAAADRTRIGVDFCRATSDAHCAQSERCKTNGDCALAKFGCEPGSAENCAINNRCELSGRCGFANGNCVATVEGCKAAKFCESKGECGIDPERPETCNPTSDKHCTEAKSCEADGECGFENGECVATKAGCLASSACKSFEKCVASDKGCVKPTE